MTELRGTRFGKLTAIEAAFKLGNRYHWLCNCDCGNAIVVKSSLLVAGSMTNCGCDSLAGNPRSHIIIRRQYNMTVVKRSRDMGRTNLISLEQFSNIILKSCFYCGASPSGFAKGIKWIKDTSCVDNDSFILVNGIDRIDSDKGYEIDNVRPCCNDCNSVKNNLKDDEFMGMVLRIYNHWAKKYTTNDNGNTIM